MKTKVLNGLDRLDILDRLLKGRRVGLVTGGSAINRQHELAVDVLASRYQVTALFNTIYGIRGEFVYGERVERYVDGPTGLPVTSIFNRQRTAPTAEMMEQVDVMVFDIKEAGVRYYEYLYCLANLMKACADTQRSAVLAQIDEKLNNWAACADGLLLKTERDHYLFIFEECHYDHFVEEKFSILDAIREIKVGDVCPTLSIGIGKDADAMAELYRNARLSLEMALSRGGDQAVVRGKVDFQFYGGRSKSTEKRTKVKSRVMASALNELMADASEIYIMGHSFADMDAVGAEAGLYCIARKHGKRAQMVIDLEHNAAGAVLAKLQALPEYAGAFTSGAEAFLKMRPGALVIVVDTNRPDMVEHPQLLESSNRVAVIDHHRRAASYIENAAFSFHEPYASSASELVTELLQYLVEPADLLREEAEALLAGIVLDTKHFTLRTGGRTFEAAAFLRRAGADTTDVQRLFQSDLSEMVSRYDIIRRAELYREDIAVAAIDQEGVERVTAAQAADELLSLKGVKASFVVFPSGENVQMSARSLGEVNVQVILEALGGGGNSTTAGGRVENTDVETVKSRLLEAIDAYFEK
mgnify:CR=1 FL=1